MACNCGGSTTSNSGSTVTLNPAPIPGGPTAPDGTPIGQDISKGGTVPAYGTAGGSGRAGPTGGYVGSVTQHATGLGVTIPPANSAVNPAVSGLSQKYESNNNYGAVSNNPNDPGGPSYGAYQIATKPGSMNNFLNQLQTTDPASYQALQAAGGNTAAMAGDPAFAQAWQDQAANNPQFAADQNGFIQSAYYDPASSKILANTGLDISQQSLGVQQAIYSYAVQSGPTGAANGVTAALQGLDTSQMSQQDIINAIYDQRATNMANTSSLNTSIINNRLAPERQDALAASSTTTVVASGPAVNNTQTGI